MLHTFLHGIAFRESLSIGDAGGQNGDLQRSLVPHFAKVSSYIANIMTRAINIGVSKKISQLERWEKGRR
jgi:hypothetical protein